jgi:HupE / UreJ protein
VRLLGYAALLVIGLVVAQLGLARAHDVPNEVTVLTFIRPEGATLTVLLRAPMKSLRDVDIPLRENGFLDLARVDQALRDASQLWIVDFVELYENGARLARPRTAAVRVSLPSDRSFESFEAASANLNGARLPADTELYWEQGMLDVAYEFAIQSDRSDFAIKPGLTRLGLKVNVLLRFLPPGSEERAFDVHADVGIVHLDPSWLQAFTMFVRDGFLHILDGIDHLLFLACLAIPLRRLRPLAVVVTAFTVAHSITLIAAALGFVPDGLWFPPLVETLIAATILYMALENILGVRAEARWIVTFAFGLIHGFAFSFALQRTLQFAGDHLLSSLLAFNVGVELGQLAVLAVLVPALALLFRHAVAERIGAIVLSALAAHVAWHWLAERWEVLARFPVPEIDAAFLLGASRGLMAAIVLGALVWLAHGAVRRWAAPAPARAPAE